MLGGGLALMWVFTPPNRSLLVYSVGLPRIAGRPGKVSGRRPGSVSSLGPR